MADYPDWTDLIQITGTDIMVPIDIQGAYIMMPVDIQAQYVDLEVDIVAQTVGNVTVDIAAQSMGDLTVNITAQDIENLNIAINAQNLGVYLQPEWAALTGVDKDILGWSPDMEQGTLCLMIDYTVPTGKTLYISHAGLVNIQMSTNVLCMIYETVDNVWKAVFGGAQGCFASFNKPLVIEAGHHLYVYGMQFSEAASDCRAHIGGYEV